MTPNSYYLDICPHSHPAVPLAQLQQFDAQETGKGVLADVLEDWIFLVSIVPEGLVHIVQCSFLCDGAGYAGQRQPQLSPSLALDTGLNVLAPTGLFASFLSSAELIQVTQIETNLPKQVELLLAVVFHAISSKTTTRPPQFFLTCPKPV